MGYLTNFIVYTMAMVGIMGIAILIFKNSMGVNSKGGTKYMKVLDTLTLGPRKTLYIVSAGDEKFLIAGDVDRTTLISKLNSSRTYSEQIPSVISAEKKDYTTQSFSDTIKTLSKEDYTDKFDLDLRNCVRSSIGMDDKSNVSVMRKLAQKMTTAGSGRE